MANKHFQMYPTSLVIRETQLKIMKYCFIVISCPKFKTKHWLGGGVGAGMRTHATWRVRMMTLKSNLAIGDKALHSAFRYTCYSFIYVHLESYIKMFNGCPLQHLVIVKKLETT